MQVGLLKSRSEKVMAQGATGTNSKRPDQFVMGVYPTHITKASGCYLWDDEGNKYIDFISGLGTNILGYNHPRVTEAVKKAIDDGLNSTSLPTVLEIEVAERICDMVAPFDAVRFLKTGNEATLAAIKIARTYTKREGVVSDGYHGHGDLWTSLTPPSLGVKDLFHIEKVGADTKLNKSVAAYILEPVNLDLSSERMNHLKNLEVWSDQSGTVLIFDEVITGMRVPGLTIAEMAKVTPGMMVLGKAIANGYPLAVVGGKREIMNCDEYFVSSTYSGEGVALAACKATLDELASKNLKDLMFYGNRFRDKFNVVCEKIGVNIAGYGTRGMLNVKHSNTALLMQECCRAGILLGKAWFYTFAHLEADIEEQVFNVISDISHRIEMNDVVLSGSAPKEVFIR